LVLCVESTDVPALPTLDGLAFRPDAALVRDGEDTVQVAATVMVNDDERAWPYGSTGEGADAAAGESTVTLIPYHRWAQRGPSTMRVWLPVRGV
jgi:DUF1680 family protein